MFSAQELENFNCAMVGRGAPVVIDGVGYNKPDYSICRFYYNGLSNAQLADLSARLTKYSKQLGIDKEILEENAEYYAFQANESNLENSVSIVSIDKQYTELGFKYDAQIISIIKSAKNRKYNPAEKTWLVSNNEIDSILSKLQENGYDTINALVYVKENMPDIEVTDEVKEVEKLKITIEEKTKNLLVSFPYKAEIVEKIKELKNRKYDPSKKAWIINKSDAGKLIAKLMNLENVDYSALQPFADGKIEEEKPEEQKVFLKDFSYLTRKPFNHQIIAGEFLLNKKKAILGDEMGGGKTLSAILACESIPGKKLIVCPSTVKYNWQNEIEMVSDLHCEIINGQDWITSNGYTIINYDILCKHIEAIEKANFAVVVFDEAHYGKSVQNSGKPGSKRAEMMVKISSKTEYAFLLTGTPITNRAKDIFNLLKCCNHELSRKFFPFGKRYCDGQHNGYGWEFNGYSNQKELNEKMKSVMLRRLKVDLLDLPEKIRSFIPNIVDLKDYNSKLDEYMKERESLETRGEHLVYLNAMRMILAKEKTYKTIEFAKEIVEQGKPVVIFTCYNYVLDQIQKEFGDNMVRLDGSVSPEDRQQLVDKFQNGKVQVFSSNIIAGGVGITLTASDVVIFNDYDWTPANHAQAEDRIHRIGQTNRCNIYYMYAKGAVSDERITELIDYKLRNITQIIDNDNVSFINDLIENI